MIVVSSVLSSQSASHKTGIPISALDISPQRTYAILAGRDILKTIRVADATCAEELNLRAAIISYSSTHSSGFAGQSARLKDDLAAVDVKWSHGQYCSTVATAAANGRILLYDLNRAGVELARLHEHHRQVHRLAFNPHQGYYLLSASQDATLRLWDLRDLARRRSAMTFRSVRKYVTHAEGIRDVKWSPTDGTEFACGTDAGMIQRWDFRREVAPLLKVAAHRNICHSIDWHPDGKYLASAGADKMVRVWDLSCDDRRQNPPWTFRAPQPVLRARWRPAEWTTNVRGRGAWETAQLVTSYHHQEPRVHLWNLRRPHVPEREMDQHHSTPTDLLWHSADLLWTVGLDGIFTQTDIQFTMRPEDRRKARCFDIAPDGELTLFTQRTIRPRLTAEAGPAPDRSRSRRESESKSASGEKLSGSRSTTDDEVAATLLARPFRLRQSRARNVKASKSAGNTPPSASENFGLVVRKLDEVLDRRQATKTDQVGICGHLPGPPVQTFYYLATNYRHEGDATFPSDSALRARIRAEEMEWNASLAEEVGYYRIAQTWRMLGLALRRDLRLRSERAGQRAQRMKVQAARAHSNEGASRDDEISTHVVSHHYAVRTHVAAEGETKSVKDGRLLSRSSTPLTVPRRDDDQSAGVHDDIKSQTGDLRLVSSMTLEGPTIRTVDGGVLGARDNTWLGNRTTPGSSAPSTPSPATRRNEAATEIRQGLTMQSHSQQPLQLEDQRMTTPGSPSSRVRRLDSIENCTMFPVAPDGAHQDRPSSPRSNPHGNVGHHQRSMASEDDAGFPEPQALIPDGRETHNANTSSQLSISQLRPTPSGNLDAVRASPLPQSVRHVSNEHSPRGPRSSPLQSGSIQGTPSPGHSGHLSALSAQQLPIEMSPADKEKAETSPQACFRPLAEMLEDPLSTVNMLAKAMEYYLNDKDDIFTPSVMLLFLQQLFPDVGLDEDRAAHMLRALLRQFEMHGLFEQAAHLRKRCYPRYPVVYDHSLYNVEVRFGCTDCRSRMTILAPPGPDRIQSWVCDKCRKASAPCPICRASRGKGLWTWCHGCGHGGHSLCLTEWWQAPDTEGGCPLQGCLHVCAPSSLPEPRRKPQRSSSLRRKEEEDRSRLVKGDDWVVGESKAVERVRGGLVTSPHGIGGRAGSGGGGGDNENGGHVTEKKVKVVTPREEEEEDERGMK